MSPVVAQMLDNLRRAAERARDAAHHQSPTRSVDAWQHQLDEIANLKRELERT